MIPRIVEEKLKHHGCKERVLRHGSAEDCVNSLLGIKHDNDS